MKDLRLDRNIQGCGGLICDQDLRITAHGHGDHHTLAHTAGKLVGIAVHSLFRVCDANGCEKLQHPGLCFFFVHIGMAPDQLYHLIANSVNRIQCGKRILKDHGDLTTADLTERCFIFLQDIFSPEQDLTTHDLTVGWSETENGFGGHAFSASGLSYDPEKIPLTDGKTCTFYCLCLSKVCKERHLQIFYFQ